MGIGATPTMTAATVLRAVAFVMAGVGVLDPACVVQRQAPVAVDVRGNDALRQRLVRALNGTADLDSALKPAAVVLTGGAIDADSIPAGIPVSTVRADDIGPNVNRAGSPYSCRPATRMVGSGPGSRTWKTHGREVHGHRARRARCRADLRSTYLEPRRRERGARAHVRANCGWSPGASGDRAAC